MSPTVTAGGIGYPLPPVTSGGAYTLQIAEGVSLELARHLLGWSPWHFWQFEHSRYAPVASQCNTVLYEWPWLNADAMGRAELAEALRLAQEKLAPLLGFYLTPTQGTYYPSARGSQGLGLGWVEGLGTLTLTSLGAVPLTFSDEDGDGLEEAASFALPEGLGLKPSELVIGFTEADRAPRAGGRGLIDPVWVEVDPASGLAVGGTINSWQAARPRLYQSLVSSPLQTLPHLDPTDPASFASEVELYKREVEPLAKGGARLLDRSSGLISLSPGWDDLCKPWEALSAVPFVSGYPIGGPAAQSLYTAVLRLALAETGRPICSCVGANQEVRHWQADLARAGGELEEQFRVPDEVLTNPLGTRRGAYWAWQVVKQQRLLWGVPI